MGEEVADYWYDIYDLFWLKGKMIVQKLNGGEFTEGEIKTIFWDLFENMSEDNTVIKLWVPHLSKLEFWHYGDLYEQMPELGATLEKLDEVEIDKLSDSIEKILKGVCEMNLEQALLEREKRELKGLCKGFKIKEVWVLNLPENSSIKKILEYYQKAKNDPEKWALNLYHIIGGLKKGNEIKKARGLLNNKQISGSRHEAGADRKTILRSYTKEEKILCEKVTKKYINSLIIKSGLKNFE
ncbi:MAG: hypothetical protein Q8P79_03225 [Nanoarchaeota archaeon]|nr:hypothetical protein [Nanoarchaeota archaeon]